jgi:hypothetical protein
MPRLLWLAFAVSVLAICPVLSSSQPPLAEKEQILEQAREHHFTIPMQRAGAIYRKDPAQALRLLDDKDACPVKLRDFAWHYLHNACQAWQPETIPDVFGEIVVFSPVGNLLAIGDDGFTTVLELDGYKQVKKLHYPARRGLAFSPDGKKLFTADRGRAYMHDLVGDNKPTQLGPDAGVNSLALSPKGDLLALST